MTLITPTWLARQAAMLLVNIGMLTTRKPLKVAAVHDVVAGGVVLAVGDLSLRVSQRDMNRIETMECGAVSEWLMTDVILPQLLPYGY